MTAAQIDKLERQLRQSNGGPLDIATIPWGAHLLQDKALAVWNIRLQGGLPTAAVTPVHRHCCEGEEEVLVGGAMRSSTTKSWSRDRVRGLAADGALSDNWLVLALWP